MLTRIFCTRHKMYSMPGSQLACTEERIRRLCTSSNMKQKAKSKRSVSGMHDLMPEAYAQHDYITSTAAKIAQAYGCRGIATPIVERAEVFQRTLGADTDVVCCVALILSHLCPRRYKRSFEVGKEMFTFQDSDEQVLTLRPENTASVVRAYIENGLHNQLPLRFYYQGPMFRKEKPQKGRYRQFHQLGVELLGETHAYADVEAISMAWDLLSALRLQTHVKLLIHTMGDDETRSRYRHDLANYLRPLAMHLSDDSKRRLSNGGELRILDSKNPGDQKIVMDAPALLDVATDACLKHFDSVKCGLDALDIPYIVDKCLVRGLDYYRHSVWEFVATDALGAQATVLAGGRYSDLCRELGGPDVPGVGWAAGVERLSLLMEAVNARTSCGEPAVAVIEIRDKNATNSEVSLSCLRICAALRRHGIQTVFSYDGRASKQFASADKHDCSLAIVIGEDELAKGEVVLKNMKSGSQAHIPADANLAVHVKKSLASL